MADDDDAPTPKPLGEPLEGDEKPHPVLCPQCCAASLWRLFWTWKALRGESPRAKIEFVSRFVLSISGMLEARDERAREMLAEHERHLN